ncbi:hypothetical protein F5I97DRAFT_1938890 [Phlebopus sp. FC_14]|nr:hypothetical protein F5I97DRAFT_1938890 [Phlebopus sp. FC_14]
MSSNTSPRFRVAICGSGIGGLVLAITIGKYAGPHIPIDVYEAHGSIMTTGAGISIWPRTVEILKELGLYEDIAPFFPRPRSPAQGPYFRKSDLREGGFDWFHLVSPYGPSNIHRQELVDALERHIPTSCTFHFHKRLTTYTADESFLSGPSIIMQFADGTTASTDVLIGADGVRSAVREAMFNDIAKLRPDVVDVGRLKEYIDPTWTGVLVYRSVIPAEKLSKIHPNHPSTEKMIVYYGRRQQVMTCPRLSQHIVCFPLHQAKRINVVAFDHNPSAVGKPFGGRWVTDVSQEELLETFDSFEPLVKAILQCCDKPSRWALHVTNELPASTFGRVAIIGDACHAMTPHFGAGAGQAMEDAFVLGHLLAYSLTTLSRVPVALQVHQAARLPFSSWVTRESHRIGLMYEFMAPGYYGSIDRSNEKDDLEILSQAIIRQWSWQWKGGSVDEWKKAEKELCSRLEHLQTVL